MGPLIGRDLEDRQTEVLENHDKNWVQREPHSELKLELRQRYMTSQRSMRPLQISGLDHLETIHLRYPRTLL